MAESEIGLPPLEKTLGATMGARREKSCLEQTLVLGGLGKSLGILVCRYLANEIQSWCHKILYERDHWKFKNEF